MKIYRTLEELKTDLDGWMVTITTRGPIKGDGVMGRHR
jgi:hypothetical protein